MSPEQRLGREQRDLQHVGRLHYQHVFEPPQVLELQALEGLQGHRGEQVRGRSLKDTSRQRGVTLNHHVSSTSARPHEALCAQVGERKKWDNNKIKQQPGDRNE